MRPLRSLILCALATLSAACSDSGPEPWSAAEMNKLREQFSHIAEAYAVVDICIPMIDADKDAKRSVISKIGVRHYSQIAQFDTQFELGRFFDHNRKTAGTDEQVAELKQIYRGSHQSAAQLLTSVQNCSETVSDYANTILNTRIGPGS
jgi:hypothetical protein